MRKAGILSIFSPKEHDLLEGRTTSTSHLIDAIHSKARGKLLPSCVWGRIQGRGQSVQRRRFKAAAPAAAGPAALARDISCACSPTMGRDWCSFHFSSLSRPLRRRDGRQKSKM